MFFQNIKLKKYVKTRIFLEENVYIYTKPTKKMNTKKQIYNDIKMKGETSKGKQCKHMLKTQGTIKQQECE